MARRSGLSAYYGALLAAVEQGLLDLAATGASDVVLAREHRAPPSPFIEGVEQRASALGFVVAVVAVSEERSLESLDALLRALVAALRAPSSDERGLVPLLDHFARRHGKKALEVFDEAAREAGAHGDLSGLCRAYLASKQRDRNELRSLKSFLAGEEPPAPADAAAPVGGLSARSAKRTLAELTRLVRALGHEGTVLIVRRGGLVAELPPARRESAYTVLRELIDNADGPRGTVACRIYVCGADELFAGPRSIAENVPLATRVADDGLHAPGAHLLPHAPLVHLEAPNDAAPLTTRAPESPGPRRAKALRSVLRASHGLPPLDHVAGLTVGYERIDEAVDKLFLHTENDGSVFSLLSGDYGSGKTHLLTHLTARALGERRPVLRLGVERLTTDLGNPQRHLRRLLEGALLPGPGLPSPLDRLAVWRRTEAGERRLRREIEAITAQGGEAAGAARRALRVMDEDSPEALEALLGGHDLELKPGNAGYRNDAYSRLLLWLELLARLDDHTGPVVLIDEAENLYRGGTSRPERRTALRSLGFYCGGSLPRACVIFAVTPETLALLREEADEMLQDITEQRTALPCEDVTMLRRRLMRARPLEVARLDRESLTVLAEQLRELHATARGATRDPAWNAWLEGVVSEQPSPRELVRRVVTRLECDWWQTP